MRRLPGFQFGEYAVCRACGSRSPSHCLACTACGRSLFDALPDGAAWLRCACGSANPRVHRFCSECGAALAPQAQPQRAGAPEAGPRVVPIACESCWAPLEDGSRRFCGHCGAAIPEGAEAIRDCLLRAARTIAPASEYRASPGAGVEVHPARPELLHRRDGAHVRLRLERQDETVVVDLAAARGDVVEPPPTASLIRLLARVARAARRRPEPAWIADGARALGALRVDVESAGDDALRVRWVVRGVPAARRIAGLLDAACDHLNRP